jgi:hypothetical protein
VNEDFIVEMEKALQNADEKTKGLFNRIVAEARAIQADYLPVEAAFFRSQARLGTVKHREQIEHFCEEVQRYGAIGQALTARSIELLRRLHWLYRCHVGEVLKP